MSSGPTPSQTVGPFFSLGLCDRPLHDLVPPGTPGSVRLEGRVLDGAGDGVPDALVEVWEAVAGFGRCGTDAGGRYAFTVPPPRAPCLAVLVFARGLLKPVRTRCYLPAHPGRDADPVLAALDEGDRAALTAVPDGGALRFDVRLQGDGQTPFFAP